VLIPNVPDPDLGPVLARLNAEGLHPIVTPVGGEAAASKHRAAADGAAELPREWRLVRELEGQSYRWPEEREAFGRYRVFAADTARDGTVHIAIGEARAQAWGRVGKHLVAFLTSGAPQVPLVEFREVDDHDSTNELLAIIRGRDGGKMMYGPRDTLPDVYVKNFRTELYADRVVRPGAWRKLAVIAHEDDHVTILNHALLQARRRADL